MMTPRWAHFGRRTRIAHFAERIDKVTRRIAGQITPAGRIRVGETVPFPNLVPHSKYASVAPSYGVIAKFLARDWPD